MKLLDLGYFEWVCCDDCDEERRCGVYYDERLRVHWHLCRHCLFDRTKRTLDELIGILRGRQSP